MEGCEKAVLRACVGVRKRDIIIQTNVYDDNSMLLVLPMIFSTFLCSFLWTTENIERLWRDIKECPKRPGIRSQYLGQYLAQYLFVTSVSDRGLLQIPERGCQGVPALGGGLMSPGGTTFSWQLHYGEEYFRGSVWFSRVKVRAVEVNTIFFCIKFFVSRQVIDVHCTSVHINYVIAFFFQEHL